jgi:hypothetical protein
MEADQGPGLAAGAVVGHRPVVDESVDLEGTRPGLNRRGPDLCPTRWRRAHRALEKRAFTWQKRGSGGQNVAVVCLGDAV